MSTTTMATQTKKNKTYPPTDTSKVYDNVPRYEKPQLNFLSRTFSRINAEFCFIALEKREAVVILAILFILFSLLIYNPLSLFAKKSA